MNKIFLMGNLCDDPQISKGKDIEIASYTLAVGRNYKNSEGKYESDFIRCKAFGKASEFAQKYFHKGQKIAIVGRIQTGSYTNKEGQKVYTTEIIVSEQEFAEKKSDGQTSIAKEEGFSDLVVDTDDIIFGD